MITANTLNKFHTQFFALPKYRAKFRPTQVNILEFLEKEKLIESAYNRNLLTLFIYEFWQPNIIGMRQPHKFANFILTTKIGLKQIDNVKINFNFY